MKTSKFMLGIQAKHTNQLLKELGVDIGLSVDWSNGQPRVVAHDESVIISESGTKSDIQGVLYAIRSILYEIGVHQRLAKRQELKDAEKLATQN